MPPVTTVTVSEAESGQKLLQFLQRRVGRSVPKGAIQRWIRTGQVRVDGGRKKPFDRINAGQQVRIPPYRNEETDPKPAHAGPLDIIHQDQELLVVAKPGGLPAHGGTGHDDSVASRLAAMFPATDFTPTLIHRLDRDTSGLLLAARTYTALRRMNDLVSEGRTDKRYLAWVRGRWPHAAPELLRDQLEKRGELGAERMRTGSGKEAVCEAIALEVRDDASLLELRLLTGRTHQLRVQLSSRGHPILGDPKYGTPAAHPMLLHAYKVEIEGRAFLLRPDWPAPFAPSERFLHSTTS